MVFDSSGGAVNSKRQDVISIAHNRLQRNIEERIVDEKYLTNTKRDTEGKPLWIRDAKAIW